MLLDDNPSSVDLLGFATVGDAVLTALADPTLDPVTIGIHGAWGSGKSTLLQLVGDRLEDGGKAIVIRTNPWEYESSEDVKSAIITQVLAALDDEASQSGLDDVRQQIAGLLKRVSWTKLGIALARGSLLMQWDPAALLDAFSAEKQPERTLMGFRAEFGAVVSKLEDDRRVVVLVDDLDRCLPESVVSTLEALKLFLSVPGMAFVIAADHDLVADAIAARMPQTQRTERFARRYLEKIVQVPVYLPSVPTPDAEAYVALLVASQLLEEPYFSSLVQHCDERRAAALPLLQEMDGLLQRPDEESLRLAAQVAYGLSADRSTNPRQIKRFLNAVRIRQDVARARGIDLEVRWIVKLMLLEEQYPRAFEDLVARATADREARITELVDLAGSDGSALDTNWADLREWLLGEPQFGNADLSRYFSLAASLSGHRIVDSDRSVALYVARLLGAGEADRRLAVEELGADLDLAAQVMSEFAARVRRGDEIRPVLTAISSVEEIPDAVLAPIIEALRGIEPSSIEPGDGALMALASNAPLKGLARDLLAAPGLPNDTQEAIREALT